MLALRQGTVVQIRAVVVGDEFCQVFWAEEVVVVGFDEDLGR